MLFADLAILVIPETLKNVLIVQQHANASGKFRPHQFLNLSPLVQVAQLAKKGAEGFLLGKSIVLIDISRIGRVKGNPQENETAVGVVCLLCPLQPAQGAVYTQGEIDVVSIAFKAVTRLKGLEIHEG